MADTINSEPRRRGRPKGTGIDDSDTLRRINSLLSENAGLKPTTAIKMAGVTNPSIVRRLREKLKLDLPASRTIAFNPPASQRKAVPRRAPAKKPSAQPAPTPQPNAVASSPGAKPAELLASTSPLPQASGTSLPSTNQPQRPPSAAPARDPIRAPLREREQALLAAYLKALQATAVPSLDDELSAGRINRQPPVPAPPATPVMARLAEPPTQQSEPAATAQQPNPAQHQPLPPVTGTMFPFMPPFMQPFLQRPPAPDPMLQKQMDALKLSVEVMTAVSKLQLFAYQNTLAATPFGNMLQAQTMMGQMLLASFSGLMQGGQKPSPDKK